MLLYAWTTIEAPTYYGHTAVAQDKDWSETVRDGASGLSSPRRNPAEHVLRVDVTDHLASVPSAFLWALFLTNPLKYFIGIGKPHL